MAENLGQIDEVSEPSESVLSQSESSVFYSDLSLSKFAEKDDQNWARPEDHQVESKLLILTPNQQQAGRIRNTSQEEEQKVEAASETSRVEPKYFIEGESVDAMVKRIEREFMDNIVDIFQKPKKLEAAAAAAQEATITEENQTFSYGKLL